MTYKPNNIVSLWAIGGRIKIPFVCHNPNYLPLHKRWSGLVYKKGKFYLFQTVDVPEEDVRDIEEFVGVDFGLVLIANYLDNGKEFNQPTGFQSYEKKTKSRSSRSKQTHKRSKNSWKGLVAENEQLLS